MLGERGVMSQETRVGRVVAAMAIMAVAVFLAGCGSSDEAVGKTTEENAEVADAKAASEAAKQPPTDITVTTPLEAKPEPGKTFVWLTCDVSSCSIMGEAMKTAVESAGWKYREIAYKSADPATLAAAMRQALRYDPSYVAVSGVPPEAGWGGVVPEYEKAGVKIVASYLGQTEIGDTVIANVAGPKLSEDAAATIANWFIADSGGEGKALLQRVDDFPSLKIFADSFAKTVSDNCAACEVVNLNNTIAEAGGGGVVPAVVSLLRRQPELTYAISSHAGFVAGLPAALDSAGIGDRVKIAAENADAQSLSSVRKGDVAAVTGNPLHYAAWMIVDVALRDAQGLEYPDEGFPMPVQLLTQDVEFEISNSLDVPADYEDRFKALWHVED